MWTTAISALPTFGKNADIPLSEFLQGKENAFGYSGEMRNGQRLNITYSISIKSKKASHCWSWACSWFCPVSVGVQTAGRAQLDCDGAPCWNLGAGWSCGPPAPFLHLNGTSSAFSESSRTFGVKPGGSFNLALGTCPIYWPHPTSSSDKEQL